MSPGDGSLARAATDAQSTPGFVSAVRLVDRRLLAVDRLIRVWLVVRLVRFVRLLVFMLGLAGLVGARGRRRSLRRSGNRSRRLGRFYDGRMAKDRHSRTDGRLRKRWSGRRFDRWRWLDGRGLGCRRRRLRGRGRRDGRPGRRGSGLRRRRGGRLRWGRRRGGNERDPGRRSARCRGRRLDPDDADGEGDAGQHEVDDAKREHEAKTLSRGHGRFEPPPPHRVGRLGAHRIRW